MADHGAAQSYLTLEAGTPVLASDGAEVGTVDRVLAASAEGIFDGIVLNTAGGARFVDAPEVASIYERAVVLSITAAQAAELPEPTANPAALRVDPRDRRPSLWRRMTGRR